MMNYIKKFLILILSLCVASCGGGPANKAQIISGATSYESLMCTEGSLQLVFSDQENDPLTISLSGPDSDLFRIESKQIVSAEPLGCDDSLNYVKYEITVTASNGTSSTAADIDISLYSDASGIGGMEEAFDSWGLVLSSIISGPTLPDYYRSTWAEENGQPVVYLAPIYGGDIVKVLFDSGQFDNAEALFNIPRYGSLILADDFDSDGDDDLVRISYGAPALSSSSIRSGAYVYENINASLAGGVQIAEDKSLWYANNPQLYDLDLDGDQDILVGQISSDPSGLAYMENLGNLTFGVPRKTGASITGGYYAINNFDTDSELEMFATNKSGTNPAFYSVDGFNIQEIASYGSLSGNWEWELVDINDDGVPEVIGLDGDYDLGSLNGLILEFDGVNVSGTPIVKTGTIVVPPVLDSSGYRHLRDLLSWDVDGDGDKDLILIWSVDSELYGQVSELTDGNFQDPRPFFAFPISGSFVDLRDLDGDSYDELILQGPGFMAAFKPIKRGNFQPKP